MKHFFLFCFFFLLCFSIAEAQTNANIPSPENVLVVYNANSDTSEMIMEYYVEARGIPSPLNVLQLQLPRKVINVGDWSDPHVVKLGFDNQNIQDSTWAKWDSTHCVDTAKFHAWQYFIEEIVNPIRDHLENNDLTETIRYIVMCKGVPYKIQAVGNWSSPGNISVDGLLCMLNTEDYDDFLEAIFNYQVNICYPGCAPPPCYSSPNISNPYRDEDSGFDFDSRFSPDDYGGSWGGYDYTLSYLVSRLDGLSFEIIKDIIDKSVDADKSGEAAWIIDNDPFPHTFQNFDYTTAKARLENYGFNVVYDNTHDWLSHNTYTDGPVIGYTSLGVHAEGSNPAYQTYVQDSLLFDYANGSVFNTYESYNAYSISSIRRQGQGLMTEFMLIGGTSGAGHVWEPFATAVSDNYIYFPYYAMGYNQIDAVWQGFAYLAWRNVVVGDPLTTIAWGKQTLTENKIWSDRNLVTGEITIPLEYTLTINDDAYIDLRHQGFITGEGQLFVGSDVTFNVYDWEKALFLSYDVIDHPRLVWGAHPTFPAISYNVYRSINEGTWQLIGSTIALEYIDDEVALHPPGPSETQIADYYVTGESQLLESDPSNIVRADVTPKGGLKQSGDQNKNSKLMVYSLNQNYPNPFNPITTVNYSIKKVGLVTLKVYDILGNEVAALVNENQEGGNYSIKFNASDLPSGIYFYSLRSGSFSSTKKLILLK